MSTFYLAEFKSQDIPWFAIQIPKMPLSALNMVMSGSSQTIMLLASMAWPSIDNLRNTWVTGLMSSHEINHLIISPADQPHQEGNIKMTTN